MKMKIILFFLAQFLLGKEIIFNENDIYTISYINQKNIQISNSYYKNNIEIILYRNFKLEFIKYYKDYDYLQLKLNNINLIYKYDKQNLDINKINEIIDDYKEFFASLWSIKRKKDNIIISANKDMQESIKFRNKDYNLYNIFYEMGFINDNFIENLISELFKHKKFIDKKTFKYRDKDIILGSDLELFYKVDISQNNDYYIVNRTLEDKDLYNKTIFKNIARSFTKNDFAIKNLKTNFISKDTIRKNNLFLYSIERNDKVKAQIIDKNNNIFDINIDNMINIYTIEILY